MYFNGKTFQTNKPMQKMSVGLFNFSVLLLAAKKQHVSSIQMQDWGISDSQIHGCRFYVCQPWHVSLFTRFLYEGSLKDRVKLSCLTCMLDIISKLHQRTAPSSQYFIHISRVSVYLTTGSPVKPLPLS